MRIMEGHYYYVCTNYMLTLACQVTSNSRRLHLQWTVMIPGRPAKTITMDQRNQVMRLSNHSMNSTVTDYDTTARRISSQLHIRLPAVNPRLDSRAYVICGVQKVANRSLQLRYHPGNSLEQGNLLFSELKINV